MASDSAPFDPEKPWLTYWTDKPCPHMQPTERPCPDLHPPLSPPMPYQPFA